MNAGRRQFRGATVLVTGAGSGLGYATAQAFAAEGARIVALDRDAAGISRLRSELEAAGGEALAVACDVTDAAACAAAVDAAIGRFGRLDVLVNNAGVSHRSGFASTGLDVIRRVMEVNFFGAVNCTKAALPHLVASRGLVIAISSVAGYTPLVARTGYAASKHAVHGFFDSLRSEVAPQGVGVTIACPSFVATNIGVNAIGGDGLPVRHAQVTTGRPITAQEAARQLLAGAKAGRRLVLIGATARQAWLLGRLAPALYERIMARRLRAELESDQRAAADEPGREKP